MYDSFGDGWNGNTLLNNAWAVVSFTTYLVVQLVQITMFSDDCYTVMLVEVHAIEVSWEVVDINGTRFLVSLTLTLCFQ